MDFDSPGSAQKAVSALKTSGVQAQMAKVSHAYHHQARGTRSDSLGFVNFAAGVH